MISKTYVASSFSSHIFWEKENHGFSQNANLSGLTHVMTTEMICKSTWTSRYSFLNVGDPYLKIVRIDIIKKSLNSKMLSH